MLKRKILRTYYYGIKKIGEGANKKYGKDFWRTHNILGYNVTADSLAWTYRTDNQTDKTNRE